MAAKCSDVNASRLASRNMDDARDIKLLWWMIRLRGQNAGLVRNALEVGKRLFVDDRWPAAAAEPPRMAKTKAGSRSV